MLNQHYSALLNRLAEVKVAALIMDQAGRVYQWNSLSIPFRQSGQGSHWQDFCLNHDTHLPRSGATVVYWNTTRKATAARLITTALQESGFTLALFIDHEEINNPIDKLGFVMYAPCLKQCYWSEYAAELHDEQAPYYHRQSMQQFLQWYTPHQRDRLLYALLECEQTHQPQQVTLRVAHSGKRLRYLWVTLPINGKPLTCAFVRGVVTTPLQTQANSLRPVTVG
ncbi:hypothetical protein [Aliidiomarina quisquiliarum]|uniref:hypothetical protein n=1 Tax=Aliidiomarina quisquiliarum TaxID=2938947 RepID=UPI00208E2C37|nr:hypothetical protein [Aliidiomarina quisquiliarum]MCO4320100.1 hypothetical protein [Aliidiomarina quisquiliarum]